MACSAFNKTRLPPELRRVLSCKSTAVFLHFPPQKKGPWGPFYHLRQVLAKGRHLLQILLKALNNLTKLCRKLHEYESQSFCYSVCELQLITYYNFNLCHWYFWENDLIFSDSHPGLGTRKINGGGKFLEIKVQKMWVLMFVIDWNLARYM